MKPAYKVKSLVDVLDKFAEAKYGRKASESIANDICVFCGGDATHFVDEISCKEYSLSGMCQKCQNEFFNGGG